MNRSTIEGYFCIIASAVIFGCMPLGVKLIYAEGVNSLSMVLLRNFLPLPFLALLAVRGGGSLKLPKGSLKETALIALFSGCLTASLLFSSYNYISSGTATVFHFIYPAATVLGSALFLREKIGRGPMICILICTAGIALFYNPADPIDPRGSALALYCWLLHQSAHIPVLCPRMDACLFRRVRDQRRRRCPIPARDLFDRRAAGCDPEHLRAYYQPCGRRDRFS